MCPVHIAPGLHGYLYAYLTAFDKKKFLKYVEGHIMPEAKGDEELEEEIRSQLKVFLQTIDSR